MKEVDWQTLAARAVDGDKAAFEEMYRLTEKAVYFTCLKLLGNEHNAQDIMQDTYMKALDRLSTLEDFSRFPGWISRIAVNNCKMFFRKPVHESIEERFGQGKDIADEREFIPEEYASDEEKRRIIINIIDTVLSDVQRQTIILYYYSQMSVSEIASVMDCPDGTVKYRLSSAREKIREAILIYEKENDDRLHAILPIPVLTSILRTAEQETVVPDIQLFKKSFSAPDQKSVHNAARAETGGKSNMTKMLKVRIIAGISALALIGGGIAAGVALNNKNSNTGAENSDNQSAAVNDNDNSGGAESSKTDTANAAELNGIPECEMIKGGLYSVSGGNVNVEENEGDYRGGTIKWGKYYSPNDYKIYIDVDDTEAFSWYDQGLRTYEPEDSNQYYFVNEPYNDKNIMFIRTDRNHSIEIPDTGDVTIAFLAADDVTLVCISKNVIRGFSTEDGSKLWEASADAGTFFDCDDDKYSTDKKKLIVNMYIENGDIAEYSDSMIVDLTNGQSKKLTYSGVISDYENAEIQTVENESVTASAVICGDKYLCRNGKGRCGEDLCLVVDESGKILLSTDVVENSILPIKYGEAKEDKVWITEAYATESGNFVFFTDSLDHKADTSCIVLDNDLAVLTPEFTPNYWQRQLAGLDLYGDSQTIFAGENSYDLVGNWRSDETNYAFNAKGEVLPGFNVESMGQNAYMFNSFFTVPEGEDIDPDDLVPNVINLYTGKVLEGYSKEGSQGDVAYLTKGDTYGFYDADLNLLYEVPSGETVDSWANYEGSDYIAYSTENGAVYAINKATKEVTEVKGAEASPSGEYNVLVNGDIVLYTLNNRTELYAYSIASGENKMIFSVDSDGQSINFSYDERQNNWFYVYRGDDNYEAYVLK